MGWVHVAGTVDHSAGVGWVPSGRGAGFWREAEGGWPDVLAVIDAVFMGTYAGFQVRMLYCFDGGSLAWVFHCFKPALLVRISCFKPASLVRIPCLASHFLPRPGSHNDPRTASAAVPVMSGASVSTKMLLTTPSSTTATKRLERVFPSSPEASKPSPKELMNSPKRP